MATSFLDQVFPITLAERAASLLELPDWVLEMSAEWTYSTLAPVLDPFEAAVKASFPDQYRFTNNFLKSVEHPFAKRLPLMNPCHVLFGVLFYFALILATLCIGKLLGKGNYKMLGLFHNYLLHMLSLYMSVGLCVSARAAGYSLWNNAAGTTEKEWRIAKFIWVFYISKIPEWMDTVLMELKQNYHQVSFLHVYHHITIFVIWWFACWMAPGGEAYYSAMVNSSVHVVMYGYYFLTMIFSTGAIRNFLSNFKFIITKGQMTQFAFNCLQSVYDLIIVPRGQLKYSAGLLQLLFWYMISLLALFGNFLITGQKKHKKVQKQLSANGAAGPAKKAETSNGKAQQQDSAPQSEKSAPTGAQKGSPAQTNGNAPAAQKTAKKKQ
ncbi:elongation of very long chain fatty acids protein 4 [Strigomonas culicis]|uniref:Elongation of fatty acids protein n=1 Tax=Strigomonas culicis TaxID=28005 RepID=S9URG8_9TRYP|nr:elongation of very long chain fatty acids protein 4 [Strigomonas culicis]|eukprot:EPY31409.1 elongation of very long chain fatty acids protein 4 [Strigomonas culicis]